MREKLCLFILPYFGKFKNYFQIFLDSFSFNKHFDLLIITDQDMVNYTIPENVIIHKTTFDKFREFIKKKFGFSISLNNPYKLCDYKPTFGYLLEGYDFFKKYKYWGHLDSDMIIGNLDVIIPLLDENQYLKLFANGHMTIYLNNKDNNVRFMNKLNNRVIYKESFTLDKIYGFDEGGNNYNNELLSDVGRIEIELDKISSALKCLQDQEAVMLYSQLKIFWESGGLSRSAIDYVKKVILKLQIRLGLDITFYSVAKDLLNDSLLRLELEEKEKNKGR